MARARGRPKKAKGVRSILADAGVMTVAQLRGLDEEAISVNAVTGALSVAQLHSLGKDEQPVPVVVEVLTDGRISVIQGTLTVAQLRSLDEEAQSDHVIGSGSASLDELPDLLQDIQTIPEVAALAPDKQRELALLLLNALGFYRVGEDLKDKWPFPWKRRPRGRTPQHHQDRFSNECVAAWRQVTGDTVQVWYNDARDEKSITMKIADAALSGRGGWVGVSGFKKRARRASEFRRIAGP